MNISPRTDLKLPTHRVACPYCQQTLGEKKMTKLRTTFVFTSNGNKIYEICNNLFHNYFIVVTSGKHTRRAQTCFGYIFYNNEYL